LISVKVNINLNKAIKKETEKRETAIRKKLVSSLVTATPVDTGEARASWAVIGKAIVNTAEHIEALNHGHSKQAPAFFIEQTVLEHEGVRPSGIIVRSS
jgi:hypothetical protein